MLGNFAIVTNVWDMLATSVDRADPSTWQIYDQHVELLEIRDPCDIGYHTFSPTLATSADTEISAASTGTFLVYKDLKTTFIADSEWTEKDFLGDDRKYCQALTDTAPVVTCNTRASSDMSSAPSAGRTDGWGLTVNADCSLDYSGLDLAGLQAADLTEDSFVITIPGVVVTIQSFFYESIKVTVAAQSRVDEDSVAATAYITLKSCSYLWPSTLASGYSMKSSLTSTEIIVIKELGMKVTFPADVFMPSGSMCGGTYAQEFDLGSPPSGMST